MRRLRPKSARARTARDRAVRPSGVDGLQASPESGDGCSGGRFAARRQLRSVQDRVAAIGPGTISLLRRSLRNEIDPPALVPGPSPRLGVRPFPIVDNASTDGTTEFLQAQPDVSLWHTDRQLQAGAVRRGLADLAADAAMHTAIGALRSMPTNCSSIRDWDSRDLRALTDWLDRVGSRPIRR